VECVSFRYFPLFTSGSNTQQTIEDDWILSGNLDHTHHLDSISGKEVFQKIKAFRETLK
jgi:hypothetical protein